MQLSTVAARPTAALPRCQALRSQPRQRAQLRAQAFFGKLFGGADSDQVR